jgi:hypothetical protein
MKIIERTFDAITGETLDVERDMTPTESAQYAIDLANMEAETTAKATKAAEKAALLAKLGITDNEAKLLLS